MAHFIEIDGIREKLYLMMQMSLAAESFVSSYAIGVKELETSISKEQYWNHIKSTVSNYSLEVSVKLRNAIELLESRGVEFSLNNSISVYYSGGGKEQKDIGFIFNKIIHAKSFQVAAVGSTKKHERLLWWDGTLTLAGNFPDSRGKGGAHWNFFFDVLEWCQASLSFLSQVETSLKNIQLNSADLISRKWD